MFTFRTDDANIAISQLRLESSRLMTTNRREAVLDPLKRAERVEIRDSWAGLGRPHSSHVLRRVADRIEGAAAVPVRVFENFIKVLLTTPFVPGQYEPALMHTDGTPQRPTPTARRSRGDERPSRCCWPLARILDSPTATARPR